MPRFSEDIEELLVRGIWECYSYSDQTYILKSRDGSQFLVDKQGQYIQNVNEDLSKLIQLDYRPPIEDLVEAMKDL